MVTLASLLSACGDAGLGQRPNVLLVSIDALRADQLDKAPFLSRLAEQGRTFRRAYASSNWTLPSHISLFISQPYFEHNAPGPGSDPPHSGVRLPSGRATLAGALQAAGWATAATTEGAWMRPVYGLGQGFERFDTATPLSQGGVTAFRDHLEMAREFIARRGERPFFLFVHTYRVHDHFVNSEEYHDLLTPPDAPYAAWGNLLEAIRSGRRSPPPVGFTQRLYAGGVRRTDRFVEELVDTVLEASDDQALLVVVTSDHGEMLGDRPGSWGHGQTLEEVQIRIPLIAWSNHDAKLRGAIDAPASTIDVAPSILRRLGVEIPASFRGTEDLFLEAPTARTSPVLARHYSGERSGWGGRINQAVIVDGWKYLRTDRYDGTSVSERCFPLAEVPADEHRPGFRAGDECARFRRIYARLLENDPHRSLVVEGSETVRIEVGAANPRAVLAAVQPALPSPSPLVVGRRIVWRPERGGSWLLLYPRGEELHLRTLEIAGRLVAADLRLSELTRRREPVFRSGRVRGDATLRASGFGPATLPAEQPDAQLLRELEALGYLN